MPNEPATLNESVAKFLAGGETSSIEVYAILRWLVEKEFSRQGYSVVFAPEMTPKRYCANCKSELLPSDEVCGEPSVHAECA